MCDDPEPGAMRFSGTRGTALNKKTMMPLNGGRWSGIHLISTRRQILFSYPLYTPPIHPQVPGTCARGGSDVDLVAIRGHGQDEVVHKPQDRTKLCLDPSGRGRYDGCPFHGLDDGRKGLQGVIRGPLQGKRFNPSTRVFCEAGHTIGCFRTIREKMNTFLKAPGFRDFVCHRKHR